MIYQNESTLFDGIILAEENGSVTIKDPGAFRLKVIDNLVDTIILGSDAHIKRLCYWITYNACRQLDVRFSSIQGLYEAMGRKER